MTEVTDAGRSWARRAEAGWEDPAAMTGRAGEELRRSREEPGLGVQWEPRLSEVCDKCESHFSKRAETQEQGQTRCRTKEEVMYRKLVAIEGRQS